MLTRNAKGVFVIAPTPFMPDGALDLASADRMTDAFLAAGASGLTLLGVMGEAPKLDQEEAISFVKRVINRVAGRVPVVVGAPNILNFAPTNDSILHIKVWACALNVHSEMSACAYNVCIECVVLCNCGVRMPL